MARKTCNEKGVYHCYEYHQNKVPFPVCRVRCCFCGTPNPGNVRTENDGDQP